MSSCERPVSDAEERVWHLQRIEALKNNKEWLLRRLEFLKDKMGGWKVSLGKWTQERATHGYWFNGEEYIVYSNNVGGRQNIWLRTKDEVEALRELLKHVQAQVDMQAKLDAAKRE